MQIWKKLSCSRIFKISHFCTILIFTLTLKLNSQKTRKSFQDKTNFQKIVFLVEVGNFWGFQVFDFGTYTEIVEKSEKSEMFSGIPFIWGSWKFAKFLSFWFCPLNSTQDLGELSNFSRLSGQFFQLKEFEIYNASEFWIFLLPLKSES